MRPARIALLPSVVSWCALGLLSAAALGQETAPAQTAPPASRPSPAPAASQPAPAASQPVPAASQPAPAQSQSVPGKPPSVTPPAGAPVTPRAASKDDEFIPTEELNTDEEVTFPVDI